jgi:hypothetical protein
MGRIINELSFFRSEYLSLAQITNKHLNNVIKELFLLLRKKKKCKKSKHEEREPEASSSGKQSSN